MSDVKERLDAVRDACQVCDGFRGGMPGNEHYVCGVLVCDYCSYTVNRFLEIKKGSAAIAALPSAEELAQMQREAAAWPDDIRAALLAIGEVEWGATGDCDIDGHLQHLRETLEITDATFDQSGPTKMHGLYLKGTETLLCHTGTSPNSPQHARILAAAWNRMVSLAVEEAAKGGQANG